MHKQVVFDGPAQWPSGGPPPMGVKRGKDKKDKGKKKDKKKTEISTPLNVRHVGMQNMDQFTNPLAERSNYPVEHLATMAIEGQLSHVSPQESIRKVRDLVHRGNVSTKEIILSVSSSEISIKDGSTRTSLNTIPVALVLDCKYIQDASGNVLMVSSQDPVTNQPRVHFFQCTKGSAEAIYNQVKQGKRLALSQRSRGGGRIRVGVDQTPMRDNWILEQRPPPPFTPPTPPSQPPTAPFTPPNMPPPFTPPNMPPPFTPPSMPPPFPPGISLHPPSPTGIQPPPPTMPSPTGSALPHTSSSSALPGAFPFLQDQRDDISVRSSSSSSKQKRHGDHVSKASTKYASNVHKAAGRGTESEIKRTIKASKIQRDVDILNHVFDDLEGFMQLLKNKAAAWTELEKKSKKSRRKKNDTVLENLKKKAEPPNEQEFIVTYQKCKYGINQIAKLGHHLSSPSAGELLKEIFNFIQHFINLNKGYQLASGVMTPLFTANAASLMSRRLSPRDQEIWNQLGMNWIMTLDSWPANRPLPPEYIIEFSDGCIPPNLHNASDTPANFPTLDTLPREQRSPDYSDAYDGDQADLQDSSRLMINPAVMAAVASQAANVTSPILPAVNRRSSDTSIDPRTGFGGPSTRSQQSLNSEGSNDQDERKMAKVLLDYQASSLEELTIRRGEKLEVLDDSKKWWRVKNRFNAEGYVPSNLLELVIYKKRGSGSDLRSSDELINVHGRTVPAPPKFSPPPVPSPGNNRRPAPNTGKYSPQMSSQHRGKASHPQSLPTVTEVSESRTSTMSRSRLPPPPTFSPAPPAPRPPGGNVPPPPPIGVPAPPPPPPIATPQKQTSLNDMIQQHKLKTAQQGKSSKKKVGNVPDNGFDIAAAMKSRKPLRKTSTSVNLPGVPESPAQQEIQSKFRNMGLEAGQKEEADGAKTEYVVMPWKGDKAQIKQWLLKNGYQKCIEKVTVSSGSELYEASRDGLKDQFGVAEGTRLFSHLQKDKARAQREGGAVQQSEFQKLMSSRKAAADAMGGGEPTMVRGWGRSVGSEQEPTGKPGAPSWQQEMAKRRQEKLTEKETVLDDTLPRDRRKNKDRRRKESRENQRPRRNSYHHEEREKSSRSRKSSRNQAISDDEGYRTRRGRRRNKKDSSDYDSDYDRKKKRRGKHRGPTNIDDYSEDDWSDSSYSSDYSTSSYSSDDSRRHRRRMRNSASVSDMHGTAWALSGPKGDMSNIAVRIKAQQAEIKKQLGVLTQLQNETGLKALPGPEQAALQKDLAKLEQLQTKLRHKQGDQNLQMQLLGQQMLLCEHLKEAQKTVIQQPGLAHSPSGQGLRMQMIQQQQHALAEQQRQLMFEQQRQMMLVAGQRQMQMAGALGSPGLLGPQPGFSPMPPTMPGMYSPYSGTVGYF